MQYNNENLGRNKNVKLGLSSREKQTVAHIYHMKFGKIMISLQFFRVLSDKF